MIKAACDRSFTEATSSAFDVNVPFATAAIIEQFLAYLYTCDYHDQSTSEMDGMESSSRLLMNVDVYLLAEYFQVPDLKEYAISKVKPDLLNCNAEELSEIITKVCQVYSIEIERQSLLTLQDI